MARNTATKSTAKLAPAVVAEESAKTADVLEFAKEIAAYADADESRLQMAQRVRAAAEAGVSLRALAVAVSEQRAIRAGLTIADKDRPGIKLTHATLGYYSGALAFLKDAKVEETPANFASAFRIVARTKSADRVAIAKSITAKRSEAGRENELAANARDTLRASYVKSDESRAAKSPKTEAERVQTFADSVAMVDALALGVSELSESERVALSAAVERLSAALSNAQSVAA